MFHFQIKYIKGKDNVIADALSPRPQISSLSIGYHLEFSDMINQYATDPHFAAIWDNLKSGGTHPNYSLNERYLLMENCICVIAPLWQKVMMESHLHPMLDIVERRELCLSWRGIFISLLYRGTYTTLSESQV